MVKSANESIKRNASNSEIYGNMQAVFVEIDISPDVSLNLLSVQFLLPIAIGIALNLLII